MLPLRDRYPCPAVMRAAGQVTALLDENGIPMRTPGTSQPGPGESMITLCERCYTMIDPSEPMARRTHLERTDADGAAHWVYSYLHHNGCISPRPAAHQRPDTGDWDTRRGIGKLRFS